jgi:hypothetical protein
MGTIINEGTIVADGNPSAFNFDSVPGGDTSTTTTVHPVDVTGVTDPAPQLVYQTAREGFVFAYTLSNLESGASYTVRLHFAEIDNAPIGARVFDVTINDTNALTDFDIAATAGGLDKALVENFTAVADTDGTISVFFDSDFSLTQLPAQINGIELLDSGGNEVQGIDCGLVSSGAITIGGSWVNAAGATVSATRATLNLGDQYPSSTATWRNAGTISATNSTVNLGGSFALADLGTFNRSGGTVNLVGTLNASASGLVLDDTTGSWNLAGGTILGGTYRASDGAELLFTTESGTLDGVTAASDLNLTASTGVYVYVVDGLTLDNATVRLGDAQGATFGEIFFLFDDQTLGGTGTVLLGGSDNNGISVDATLTIGPGITVRGSTGFLAGTIINQGTISADETANGFAADRSFSGDTFIMATADTIDVSGVSNAAPQLVYQTARTGDDFSYALADLNPGANYWVRLHFAEIGGLTQGERLFNVSINNTQVLQDFDIAGSAGDVDKAVVEEFMATAGDNGAIIVGFHDDLGLFGFGAAQINGIEVLDDSGTVVQAINCGPVGTISINSGMFENMFENQGTLSASSGGILSISNLAPNAGTIFADVGGSILINGDFAQDASGTVSIAIGGTSTVQMGQIAINGAAALDGTLNISFVNGFTPSPGNNFQILTYASETGAFATTNIVGLSDGLTLDVQYNLTDLSVEVQ